MPCMGHLLGWNYGGPGVRTVAGFRRVAPWGWLQPASAEIPTNLLVCASERGGKEKALVPCLALFDSELNELEKFTLGWFML